MVLDPPGSLEFGAFAAVCAHEMGLDPRVIKADSRLVEDLGLDSVRILELIIVVEELGVELEDAELETLGTFGDAFSAYLRADGSPSSRRIEEP